MANKNELKIEYRKTSELIPYVNNSRTHSDEQVTQIASSMKEFGFTNPLLLDEDGGIIAGHGRLQAATLLDMDEVPTITLSGLTKAQRKAYVIADNQLALNAGWDLDTLKLEIETLQELDFDTDVLGFDEDFLASLSVDEVEFPELPDGEREPFQQITFTLHDSQADNVKRAVDAVKHVGLLGDVNENSNGNAINAICEAYLAQC
jgi:ParB-like chromosome segregation protein Spo0J